MSSQKTYYEILNVKPDVTTEELKQVYKKILLSTHPDKQFEATITKINSNNATVTIDQIKEAYRVLNDPKLRSEYQNKLLLQGKKNGLYKFGEGIDEFSLDTFTFNEVTEEYMRDCPRCHNQDGFKLTDDLLEDYGVECEGHQDGMLQVVIQCSACSLWIKVHFFAAEEYDEEEA